MSQRNFDSSTSTVWFVAYVAGDEAKEAIAERRFSPNFHRAFDAWIATDPATNPHAPQGPTYMPEYRQPAVVEANILNATADHLYTSGSSDGNHSDDYVRLTVYLATVLFLVAISGHFKLRSIRVALIGVSGAVLVFALIQLAALPRRPHGWLRPPSRVGPASHRGGDDRIAHQPRSCRAYSDACKLRPSRESSAWCRPQPKRCALGAGTPSPARGSASGPTSPTSEGPRIPTLPGSSSSSPTS